jgi:heptaprenyl diphosphate synthase
MDVTKLDNPQIHRVLSNAIVQMCLGEMEQIRLFFQVDQSLKDYLLRIKRKTALLLAISCQLGGLAVNASEEHVRALYDFGYNAGMAFQITDDLLDIEGTEAQIGKPPGSDVRQGNITLPYLLAMQDRESGPFITEQLELIRDTGEPLLLESLVKQMRSHESLQVTRAIAHRYIVNAQRALGRLPDKKAKLDLLKIASFIEERTY